MDGKSEAARRRDGSKMESTSDKVTGPQTWLLGRSYSKPVVLLLSERMQNLSHHHCEAGSPPPVRNNMLPNWAQSAGSGNHRKTHLLRVLTVLMCFLSLSVLNQLSLKIKNNDPISSMQLQPHGPSVRHLAQALD